jgi:hypothetical protein
MTAVATLTGALSDRLTVRRLQARMVKVGPQPGVRRGTIAFRKERWQGLSCWKGNFHEQFLGGCALQAHTVQPSAMAALTKRSQQSGTESCVGYGNVLDEA